MKVVKTWFFVIALVLFVTPVAQAAKVLPGSLVTPAWLAENLDKVVVLDVNKGSSAFETDGHISGAVFVDWSDVRANRNVDGVDLLKLVPTAEAFENLMQSKGVNQESSVVVTFAGVSTADVTFGTRLFWTLKYFGLDDVALLDGGNAQWVADGYELTTETSPVAAGNFLALKQEADMYGTTAEVFDAITDVNTQLVDVRSLSYYLGLKMKSYVYNPGHVPSAKNLPLEVLLSAEPPLTFAPVEDVARAMEEVGLDPNAAFITVCNSGHKASGLWFVVHELMGNKRSELYDGSMHEWTTDLARPVNTTME